ncbi:MAG: DUF86 domain-containing protein [bacterium]|nr:DUF86 domain-containing protein [bacterium]
MIDKEVIKNKIRDIQVYLKEMDPFLRLSPSKVIKDYPKLKTLERNFQLIVDSMVDINTHIISRQNLAVPDDYQSTFVILGQNKILPMDFALKIAPIAGLRNKIVHKYGDIDRKKFIVDLQKGTSDFKKYCTFIKKYISR